ncbi:hypothetical protein ANG5_2021, partial [Streptococcus constellatus subsp. pharyngis SK1060 = CCUG 46377]
MSRWSFISRLEFIVFLIFRRK